MPDFTASEWIALAGIALSAFLGFLGYKTGLDGRRDAAQLAREMREAQAAEAQRSRLHEARKALYVEIMEYAYLVEDTVDRTEPDFHYTGMPGPPAWPSEEEARRQGARTAVFGSKEMRDKLLDLKAATLAFRGSVFVLQFERDAGTQTTAMWADVSAKRKAVKAITLEIVEIANAEMAA